MDQLYWWLCSPLRSPPGCSGQPLIYALIGHPSDGGDLKGAGRTEGVSAGTPRGPWAQLAEDRPPVPALSRNESAAPLLRASVSQFPTRSAAQTQCSERAKQMTLYMVTSPCLFISVHQARPFPCVITLNPPINPEVAPLLQMRKLKFREVKSPI